MSTTVPTNRYHNAISNAFPTDKRTYKLESGISTRYERDVLPSNVNINSELITDNYLEFIVNGSDQEFIDLDTLSLELKISITKEDDTPIDAQSHVSLVDGFAHRILSKSSIFLNSVQCESNAFFGIWTVIKHYLSLGKNEITSHARNMFYKSLESKIPKTYTAANFTPGSIKKDERDMQSECVTGIHSIIPLNIEMADSGFYLLNGVDMRIRLDLASNAVVLGTDTENQYKYRINMARLWMKKVIPHPSALLSLSQNLTFENSFIEYLYNRPVIKNSIITAGSSNIVLDNIFNGIIPQQVIVFMTSQDALNGNYKKNSGYLEHCNINTMRLEIDGNINSSIVGSIPLQSARFFNHTLENLMGNDHLLTYDNFKEGRTIFTFDLRSSDSNDVLSLERRGNLRLTAQTSVNLTENIIIFVVGIINGIIQIDHRKTVRTNNLI